LNPVTNLGDVVARAPFLQISLMLEQPQSPLAALIEHVCVHFVSTTVWQPAASSDRSRAWLGAHWATKLRSKTPYKVIAVLFASVYDQVMPVVAPPALRVRSRFERRERLADLGDVGREHVPDLGAERLAQGHPDHVVPVRLPPLRARGEDLPLLAQYFVRKSCETNSLTPRTITQEAIRALMSYAWPGNIRQLENAMEHAVAISGTSQEITARMLPREITEPAEGLMVPSVTIPDEGINFVSVVSQLERELILRCLEKTGGNKRQAARLLNLSRTTLIDKLQRLNVTSDVAVA